MNYVHSTFEVWRSMFDVLVALIGIGRERPTVPFVTTVEPAGRNSVRTPGSAVAPGGVSGAGGGRGDDGRLSAAERRGPAPAC